MNLRGVMLAVILIATNTVLLPGQCVVDTTICLDDIDTASARIVVSGLTNNDLASNQGICGVILEFEHEYLGDMTIELISPSGQRVTLIGPQGSFGFTNFTKWDISMVPCAFPTAPDPGFSSVWDNDQPWGILSGLRYRGVYHPFGGCLEDFNTGPANGIWRFRIVDQTRFYGGKIHKVGIIFCDPEGIRCENCVSDGGIILNEPEEYYCVSDPALEFKMERDHLVPDPDSLKYGYTYLAANPDLIVEIDSVGFDFTNYPPGEYKICGLSYLREDSSRLPIAFADSISSLYAKLETENPAYCAEFSLNCIRFEILAPPDTVLIQPVLCQGDSFEFRGIVFPWDTLGGYVNAPGLTQCDSVFEIRPDFLANFGLGTPLVLDSLDCGTSSIILSARVPGSQYPPGTEFLWTTSDGRIVTDPGLEGILVDSAGIYKVVIRFGLCMDSAEFVVVSDSTHPSLTLTGGTLSCNTPEVNINVRSSNSPDTLSWYYQGSYLNSQSSFVTSDTGWYVISYSAANGCQSRDSIYIGGDFETPELNLLYDSIRCDDNMAMMEFVPEGNEQEIRWKGPNNFEASGPSAMTSSGGEYRLIVTAQNGCQDSLEFQIVDLRTLPSFDFNLDSISCRTPGFWVNVQSQSPLRTFWARQGSQLMEMDSFFIQESGPFVLRVQDSNFCLKDTLFSVHVDTLRPQGQLNAGVIYCDPDSTLVMWDQHTIGNSYAWTGPNGQINANDQFFTRLPGFYQVRVTAENGCSTMAVVEVTENRSAPNIEDIFIIRDLDCANDTGQLQAIVNGLDAGDQVSWGSRNGNVTGTSGINATIVGEGRYHLLVTDSLTRCIDTFSILVGRSSNFPTLSLVDQSNPNCQDPNTGMVKLAVTGGTAPYAYLINGELSPDSCFFGLGEGDYLFEVSDARGCEDQIVTNLIQESGPEVDLGPDRDINSGEMILIVADTMSVNGIQSIIWDPSQNCQNCNSITLSPVADQLVSVRVIDSSGCESFDEMWIRVKTEVVLTIPNIFTPNDDGLNDFFKVYTRNPDQVIDKLLIFNRWGDLVFERSQFAASDPSSHWDGKYKGKLLNPGVFVVRVEWTDSNGNTKALFGDLTLVR